VGHQAGAGRHRGRLGALLVRLPNGTDFAIGTGFSDRERENPPAVGSTVTFRYQELSEAGVPRFPSWVGVRIDAAPIVASASATSAISCAPAVPAPEAGASVITTSAGSSPKAASASSPRYFEFVEGASSKFWEVTQTGNEMTTRWGRNGSAGQSKTKSFPDEQAAANAVARLIEEKTDEGYAERAR